MKKTKFVRPVNSFVQSRRALKNWHKLRLRIKDMREQPNYLVTFLDKRDAIKKEGEDDEQQQTE